MGYILKEFCDACESDLRRISNNTQMDYPIVRSTYIELNKKSFACHNCLVKSIISSNEGFIDHSLRFVFWICVNSKCNHTLNVSFINDQKNIPIIPEGNEVLNNNFFNSIKNADLKILISEFYTCKNLRLFSSATLLARKILMHIVIDQGLAEEGKTFKEYVNSLKESDLISRNWKPRVDLIRQLGNEENHQIKIASEEEIENIANVLGNLLESIYVE